MTQPYKRCPQCGQPAVIEMPQCRRCGHSYFQPMPTAPLDVYPRIGPVPARMSRAVLTAAILVVTVLVVGAMVLTFFVRQTVSASPSSLMYAMRPPHAASSGVQSPSSSQPTGGSGLFQETESAKEMPEVTITNIEMDTMTLVLTDASGHTFSTASSHSVPATLQLPPGDYQLSISSNDPGVQTNTGDAIFRKHKHYSATFLHDSEAGPVHLGD